MAARQSVPITAAARRGGSRFFLFCLLLGLGAPPSVVAADAADDSDLARVRTLIRGGAAQLALRLVDQHQPGTSSEAWVEWEKQRYALYRSQREWGALSARVAKLPPDLEPEFVRWAWTEAAQAELNAGRAAEARRLLRALLWSGDGSSDEQAVWRQLVIRSYLSDDNVADAHTALLRYRADYRVQSPAWRKLETAILIRAGRAKEAYVLVGELKTHEGRYLGLLAALRSGVMPPAQVAARAQVLAEETRNKSELSHQAWALAAEAALRANDTLRRIYALERALSGARAHVDPDRLVEVKADDLWRAYERYAEGVGNEARLLVGNDADWLKQAESYKRDDAMQARAFYAFLATHGGRRDTRRLAAQRLTDSLVEDGRGEVLRALYSASQRYPELKQVPEYVRFRLADLALEDYDIEFAGKLLQGLDRPPGDEDRDLWALRRARVLIYAGDFRTAQDILSGLVDGERKLTEALADRVLQVLFDLQAADRHAQAIALLESLFRQVDNPRVEREILYWIAESRSVLGEHQQAAELYLRSANHRHPTGGDMWGQTARFHAGEALGKAGLAQDARLVFQALLRHTADAKQRAVIERSIQQLWLIEKRTTTQ